MLFPHTIVVVTLAALLVASIPAAQLPTAPGQARVTPVEIILVEAETVTPAAVSQWRQERFKAVFADGRCVSSAQIAVAPGFFRFHRFAVGLGVRVEEVIERFALLLWLQHNVASGRKRHAVGGVVAEEIILPLSKTVSF